MSTTVNMSMQLPTPTTTPGPDWATDLNAALEIVDAHDHTAGKGLQIPSAGLNIDADLSANSNKISDLKSTQYDNQTVAISGPAEANSVQMVAGDLWMVNGGGVAVQVTSGTSVVAPSSSNTPAGILLPYAGSSAPAGYLICDGTAVSRTTYATLFGVVGTVYGAGDGSTTFNLPNMQGRTPMGVGTYTDPVSGSVSRTLGQSVGAAAHVLTIAELAAHNHGGGAHEHLQYADAEVNAAPITAGDYPARAANFGGNDFNYQTGKTATPATLGRTSAVAPITSQGSGTAHNNMQPSLGLNYIIKT